MNCIANFGRSSIGVAAILLAMLGGVVLAIGPSQTAGAQTVASATTTNPVVRPLTVKLQILGPRPSTITGFSVTTTCRANPTDSIGVAATQGFSAFGGTATQFFSLSPTSACIVGVVPTGTGGRNAAAYLAIANTVRASGTLNNGFSMTPAQYVPVTDATTIDIVVTFASLTVRMATVGAESIPGAEYVLALVCTYNDGLIYTSSTFKLRTGATKTFSAVDIPELVVGSSCRLTEVEGNGASVVTIDTQPSELGSAVLRAVSLPDGTTPGTNPFVDANFVPPIQPRFASAGFNPNGAVITVTNRFVGDLLVSKAVVGPPRSNIAIYELQLSCNEGSVKESFLLKSGQTWSRTDLLAGWVCAISETRSDGAVVSFADNSGSDATDARVIIRATPYSCTDSRFTSFPDCRANIQVTNSYPESAESQAPSAAPPTTSATSGVTTGPTVTGSTVPETTAAPAIAAPVELPAVLDQSEETVG